MLLKNTFNCKNLIFVKGLPGARGEKGDKGEAGERVSFTSRIGLVFL